MHILISNDDGVQSPGIAILAEVLSEVAQVTVIAPHWDQSGQSSSISLASPLRVKQAQNGFWQVNGTPADCIKLGLSGFLDQMPDMVISGMNIGRNLGDDVIYSGTVGAAIEGRFLKYAPIAVSCVNHDDPDFYGAAQWVKAFVARQIKAVDFPGVIFNMNIPDLPYDQIKGFKAARQGDRYFGEPLIKTTDGRDKPIYWLGDAGQIKDGGPGTDFEAIDQGYVSVTPLHVDMTCHQKLKALSSCLALETVEQ